MDMVSYLSLSMAMKVLLLTAFRMSRMPLMLNQNMEMAGVPGSAGRRAGHDVTEKSAKTMDAGDGQGKDHEENLS
jgi:hypothetical protein